MPSYQRNISLYLLEALKDTPVVLLSGARQTGKSTLALETAAKKQTTAILTLDDITTLASALDNPQNFIAGLTDFCIIDEIQRAPGLFISIKEAVDKNRQPGRFLLTGSANVMLLPQLSDSLAGRMEIINLWPLSQGELRGVREKFIDAIFAAEFSLSSKVFLERGELLEMITNGGYPEALTRASVTRKRAWFNNYLTAILQRDIKELANVEGITIMPRLLALLAARVASLLNLAELSRSSTIPHTTLVRYLTLLQAAFLIYTLPAWSGNLSKRLVKAPKHYFSDTGLASHLMGIESKRLVLQPQLLGPLLENFVVTELKKQQTWNSTSVQFFHYRTQAGVEVDIVLENAAGECVGIEIKASSQITSQDFKGLKYFAEQLGAAFLRGIVLYTGQHILPFGTNLYAVPVSLLWNV